MVNSFTTGIQSVCIPKCSHTFRATFSAEQFNLIVARESNQCPTARHVRSGTASSTPWSHRGLGLAFSPRVHERFPSRKTPRGVPFRSPAAHHVPPVRAGAASDRARQHAPQSSAARHAPAASGRPERRAEGQGTGGCARRWPEEAHMVTWISRFYWTRHGLKSPSFWTAFS